MFVLADSSQTITSAKASGATLFSCCDTVSNPADCTSGSDWDIAENVLGFEKRSAPLLSSGSAYNDRGWNISLAQFVADPVLNSCRFQFRFCPDCNTFRADDSNRDPDCGGYERVCLPGSPCTKFCQRSSCSRSTWGTSTPPPNGNYDPDDFAAVLCVAIRSPLTVTVAPGASPTFSASFPYSSPCRSVTVVSW